MTEEQPMRAAAVPWTVQLNCGHQIEVPFVPGSLATVACVHEHQLVCRGRPRVGFPDTGFAYPMAIPRGVASR